MASFNLDDYIPVQERINRFWQEHPEGRILTQLESDRGDFERCRYSAAVYLDANDERPVATGYAFEVAGSGANRTSHEENCETSAIGRALANMGYATSHKDRPSREEMSKASRDDRPAAPVSHDKPTDKQIKMVFALARQIGFDDDKVNTLAREHGAESLSSLTRRQISALIERLQSLSDQAREQPPTQSQPMTPDDGEYSWTDFWRWARGHGFASKSDLEAKLGYDFSTRKSSRCQVRRTRSGSRQAE